MRDRRIKTALRVLQATGAEEEHCRSHIEAGLANIEEARLEQEWAELPFAHRQFIKDARATIRRFMDLMDRVPPALAKMRDPDIMRWFAYHEAFFARPLPPVGDRKRSDAPLFVAFEALVILYECGRAPKTRDSQQWQMLCAALEGGDPKKGKANTYSRYRYACREVWKHIEGLRKAAADEPQQMDAKATSARSPRKQ